MRRADVLVLTAADDEDQALRDVRDGLVGDWLETSFQEHRAWTASFRSEVDSRRTVKVVLCRSVEMREAAAAAAAARLMPVLQPSCIAMVGVCAGNPARVSLGDVIIADQVFTYDRGAVVSMQLAEESVLLNEINAYRLPLNWKLHAEDVGRMDWSMLERIKPLQFSQQMEWLLSVVLDGGDPANHSDRPVMCADWETVLNAAWKDGLVIDGTMTLTEHGERAARRFKLLSKGEKPSKFSVKVGPMATGVNLVRDPAVWERIEKLERRVLGLDMEATAIGFMAYLIGVPSHVVVKGVMDHCEVERPGNFRRFAARAAAEVFVRLIRRAVLPEARGPKDVLRDGLLGR